MNGIKERNYLMKLYIDMIAFYLQRAGGITSVWKELIIRLLRDKKKIVLILQKIKCENIYFNQIMELKPEIVYEQGIALSINRYERFGKWKQFLLYIL